MASHRKVFYCSGCDHERAFRKAALDHSFHRALSFATLGLWCFGWAAVTFAHALQPWKCTGCGKSEGFLALHLRAAADRATVQKQIRREIQRGLHG